MIAAELHLNAAPLRLGRIRGRGRQVEAAAPAGARISIVRWRGVNDMSARKSFTAEEARRIGEQVGIDWQAAPFDVEQFRRGLEVELEHGLRDPSTNVTDDDDVSTGKIALAHLNEFPDYYTRLERMEAEAKREHDRG